MQEFEKYPELAKQLEEYASFGRFQDWQKFTDILNKTLTEVKTCNKPAVSVPLPLYDVTELNILVTKFNNKEMTLYEFVSDVWNKAYSVGYNEAASGNER